MIRSAGGLRRAGWAPLWLTLILLLALVVRLVTADYSLWYDEVASTHFAATPLRLLWSDWMVRETNPPLYYTMLGGWMRLFGDGDRTLRALSVAIGTGGLALAFLVGRRVGGDRAGLIATALIAASAQHVLYSQQVRAYVLGHAAALAAVLAILLFLAESGAAADRRRRAVALAGYAAACTVALYSHTMLVLLPALAVPFVVVRLLLRRERRWRALVGWVAANAIVLLAWAWWARITLLQAGGDRNIGWIDAPSLGYAVRMTLESYVPWGIGPAGYPVALLALAAVGAMAWHRRGRPDELLLPYLALAAPPLLYLLSLKVPVFLNRTIYWPSAPFLIAAAAGIADLRAAWARWAATGVGLLATLAGLVAWLPQREIEPWKAIVAQVQRAAPGSTVVTMGRGPTLAILRYCSAPACTLDVHGLPSPVTDRWASGFAMPQMMRPADLPSLLRERRRLVAIRWLNYDPMEPVPSDARSGGWSLSVPHEPTVRAQEWLAR